MSTNPDPPHRSAGQRAGLTQESVLAAARRIADTEGVDRLTMRRLGGELGVMPNALYSYFPHKDALLDALLDDLLGDIDAGEPTEGDWRDGLATLMDSSRRLLLAHPQLVTTFLTRPGLGPNATRLGEITFTLLRRGGLDGDRAVEAFRILLIYSLGFAAFQAQRLHSEDRRQLVQSAFANLPEGTYPEMRRLAGHLAEPTGDRQYHTGLHWLLDGVDQEGRISRPSRSG
jgi:TetR/AcrR family transcriptional regulator, tetracycline repressor protein